MTHTSHNWWGRIDSIAWHARWLQQTCPSLHHIFIVFYTSWSFSPVLLRFRLEETLQICRNLQNKSNMIVIDYELQSNTTADRSKRILVDDSERRMCQWLILWRRWLLALSLDLIPFTSSIRFDLDNFLAWAAASSSFPQLLRSYLKAEVSFTHHPRHCSLHHYP